MDVGVTGGESGVSCRPSLRWKKGKSLMLTDHWAQGGRRETGRSENGVCKFLIIKIGYIFIMYNDYLLKLLCLSTFFHPRDGCTYGKSLFVINVKLRKKIRFRPKKTNKKLYIDTKMTEKSNYGIKLFLDIGIVDYKYK